MTRLSIALDPMPALRQAAEDRFDAAFNAMAAQMAHVDAAHAQKRQWAATNDPRLEPEANVRGMTVEALAALILTKPDELAEREATARRSQASHQGGRHAARIGRDQAMTKFPSYAVGTVSIDAGATVVTGAGGPLWTSTTNVRPGDDLVVAGHIVIIEDVTDDDHLEIDAWSFPAVPAGTPYKIVQRSPLRFSGAEASADVIKLVAALNTEGLPFIVPPGVAAPDPSLGEENQFGIQPSTFKLWLKTGGAWVFEGLYKGLNVRGAWDATATYAANDIVSRNGSSYVATAPNANSPPESSPMVWQLVASKGDKGDKGDRGDHGIDGIDGIDGAGYAATSATSLLIQTGAKTFATQQGLAYSAGARVRASSAANGANYMEGLATAYAGGNLTINVSKVGGAGTFADWNINVAGDPGSGDLLSANNLSDLTNKEQARHNLTVGVRGSVASASTVNLQTVQADYVHITGGTTINAFTLDDGEERTLVFDAALTLVAGASLILPGGVSILTQPGDTAKVRGEASGVVRFVNFSPVALPLKSVLFTRNLSLAAGNQSVTGVGFRPKLIFFIVGVAGGSPWNSIGIADGVNNAGIELAIGAASPAAFFQSAIAGILRDNASGSNNQSFVLASFDSDGFTITWTKAGAPSATASVLAICWR